MSIPIATPSKVSEAAIYIGAQITPERVIAASATAEALFYGCLKIGPSEEQKSIKWMRATAVTNIHRFQIAFNVINTFATFFYATQLYKKVNPKFKISALILNPHNQVNLRIGITLLALLTIGGIFILSPKKANTKREPNQVHQSEGQDLKQHIAKVLHVTKLILNRICIWYSQDRLAQNIDLIGTGYSFLQNLQVKWLKFDRLYTNLNGQSHVQSVQATYHMLIRPSKEKIDDTTKECAICKEPGNVDTPMCVNHVFHQACIGEWIKEKSKDFLNESTYNLTETKYYNNNNHISTSYACKIKLEEKNLQICPECRDAPEQNHVDVIVKDRRYGKVYGVAFIECKESDSPTFTNFYAAYTFAQAGLVYLQRFPHLGPPIYKIQQIMVVTDIVFLLNATFNLKDKLVKKWEVDLKKLKNQLGVLATLTASIAVSWFATKQINRSMESALILKDLINKLPITPENLKGISAHWEAPFSHRLLQCLYVNRIITSLALAYFSNQRSAHLISLAAQTLSLAGLSNMKWIAWSQYMEWPLKNILLQGATLSRNITEKSIKAMTLHSHFLLEPSCASEPTHLQSTLQSIHNFTQKTFFNSSWDRFWKWVKEGNREVNRLHISVTLQNNPLELCGCTLAPYFWSRSLSILDATHGKAIPILQ